MNAVEQVCADREARNRAKEVLSTYSASVRVADLYDSDQRFADALNGLVGASFEYPNYSYLTVAQAVDKASAEIRKMKPVVDALALACECGGELDTPVYRAALTGLLSVRINTVGA